MKYFRHVSLSSIAVIAFVLLVMPCPAQAYIGPALGVGTLGAGMALLSGVGAAITYTVVRIVRAVRRLLGLAVVQPPLAGTEQESAGEAD